MKAVFLRTSALLIAASLAACTTRGGGEAAGGVDISRTHLGQPLARAQIAVEPADLADANNPEFRSFAAAVERQLARHGYTVVQTRGTSEQIARVNIAQGRHAALTSGWPGIQARKADDKMLATMLDVRIQRRSDGSVVWQGRAVDEAPVGSAQAARTAAVERLAAALFQDFPGESGRTIRAR